MPIKGLTDRDERFPEIGQIRKGSPKDERGQMGRDLTYFRIEVDEKEIETKKAIIELYGEKPTELPIMLAFHEVDKVWDAWYEAYTAGRLVARADGEVYTYKIDTATGAVLTAKGETLPFDKDEPAGYYTDKNGKRVPIKCKPVGRLRVVLPGLGRLAYFTVMTTSTHDIINLSSQIAALAMFNQNRVAGIPLILKRRPKEISCPKPDGTRARYTKWMLSIEADPAWVSKSLPAIQALSLPSGAAAFLPAGVKTIVQGEGQVNHDEIDEEDNDEFIPGPNDEVVDGDFIPEPPAEPATQEKTPIDNNGHKRPYEPIILQRKFLDLVHYFEDADPTPDYNIKLDTVIQNMIENVWAGDPKSKTNLTAVIKFLTNEEKLGGLTLFHKLALWNWLKPSKDSSNEWVKCKESGAEILKVIEHLNGNKPVKQGSLI